MRISKPSESRIVMFQKRVSQLHQRKRSRKTSATARRRVEVMKFPKPSFDFPDSCLRHHKFLPHGRRCQAPKFNLRTEASSQAGSTLRRRKFDDRTLPIDDDIDQRPPRCPRKSSRSPASPPASTVATYVHPEYPVVARDRVEEQNEIGGLEDASRWQMERNTG